LSRSNQAISDLVHQAGLNRYNAYYLNEITNDFSNGSISFPFTNKYIQDAFEVLEDNFWALTKSPQDEYLCADEIQTKGLVKPMSDTFTLSVDGSTSKIELYASETYFFEKYQQKEITLNLGV
jgi:hypothetical protein